MLRERGRHFAALATVILGWLTWSGMAHGAASSSLLWQTNLEQAKQIAAQTNRLVLVHFWSPSCIACKQLEKNVFALPQVQKDIQARFVPVKVNADDWPTTTKQYGITCLPTDLIIMPSGQIVGRMVSPPTPEAYLQQLAVAASGAGSVAATPAAAYAATAPSAATTATSMGTSAPAATGWTATASSVPSPYAAASPTPTGAMTANNPANVAPNVAWGAPPANASSTAAPAVPAYSDSRYAEYYQRFSAASSGTNAAISSPNSPPAAATTPVSTPAAVAQPAYASPAYAQPAYAPPAYAPPAYAPPTYSPPASQPGFAAGAAAAPNPAAPPLALDGYCPITLVEQQRWQVGDRRWGVIHRGRTYLFAGPEEQRKFLADPDRYSPAISGQDVVMAMDYGQEVSGKRALGVEYQHRIYLFSSDASRQMFSQNPNRYAAEVLQAENPNLTTTLR
ncbi:MAG TPA: thioredoxin domain-containing protein [Pirellulales bacterium]|nr:thioredoxin domain-containing protein [Pirellulales bacterium]